MAFGRNVVGKFRSSDGRVKTKTLSGISVGAVVIALLVGVLPVMATHQSPDSPAEVGQIEKGGGSGGCDFVGSAAGHELHINNPRSGVFSGPDGTQIKIVVDGRTFSFEVLTQHSPGKAVYDVTVNGGAKSLHYAYHEPVTKDEGLHAPLNPGGTPFNLSHINICYDFQTIQFACGDIVEALGFGNEAPFITATAQILQVLDDQGGEVDCQKLGRFFIQDGETTLDFGIGDGTVKGRADFYRDFGGPDFEALVYDGGPAGDFEPVPWCTIGSDDAGEFDEFVSGFPALPGDHTACKVFESMNAEWVQHTVVYFEFEDPNFR